MLKTPHPVAQRVTVTWSRSLTFLLTSVATIAVQAQTTENLAEESLYFSGEAASGSQMMTQEVMVPVAGQPRVTWTFCTRTPWCRLRKRLWRYSRCRPLSVQWRFLRSSARKLSGT